MPDTRIVLFSSTLRHAFELLLMYSFKIYCFFTSKVLLRIPTAVQPTTGIEGFKYEASVSHTLFVQFFAAMPQWAVLHLTFLRGLPLSDGEYKVLRGWGTHPLGAGVTVRRGT